MNQNLFNNNSTGVAPVKPNNNLQFILYGCMALVVVGCFLPFLTASAFGYSESINYIYAEGSVKDGVYVLVGLLAAFFSVTKKNYKGAIAGIGVGLGVLIYDFIDVQANMDELTYSGLLEVSWGIGFYLIAIGLVGALVIAFLLNKNTPVASAGTTTVNIATPMPYQQPNMQQPNMMNNQMNQPQMNTVQPVMTAQQQPAKCQFCGNVRNEGLFCKSCGGRY